MKARFREGDEEMIKEEALKEAVNKIWRERGNE